MHCKMVDILFVRGFTPGYYNWLIIIRNHKEYNIKSIWRTQQIAKFKHENYIVIGYILVYNKKRQRNRDLKLFIDETGERSIYGNYI
ncbi:hypothetical protein acsn021_34290 [Anaerocolumna cellulosilytica]|uniref:Uncharacterized protein n=1 Tax=Anaerocolumna cellulosilytica TaxID=433286 RepID=A0A6S6R8Y5_9FIRM|nr:hypothetical protein acsn021_34290 [Anaerocolumna cellulosilytica]